MSEPLRLPSPEGAPFRFFIEVSAPAPSATSRELRIEGPGSDGSTVSRSYRLEDTGQPAYLDLFAEVARDSGIRVPVSREESRPPVGACALTPLLTETLSPDILYGYGDPAVLRVTEGQDHAWWLVVTSNDAPNVFPLLRSDDCRGWTHQGFVFPEGRTPPWTLTGMNQADFWAPEMHRIGDEFWVCFTARQKDRTLAIGMAKASRPEGPYEAGAAPLVGGDVIDSHILLDREGAPWLFWKKDDNGVWPRRLAELLGERPNLIVRVFPEATDQRTASITAALWPWVATLERMEQFAVLQPLIEAATHDYTAFGERLLSLAEDSSLAERMAPILVALKTRVYAQQLAPDGMSLVGERALVLENDQPWEAHLIEGVWVTEHGGRYYLLYAGNDFSTPHYGVGAAVADHPLGPYRKMAEPLLRSTAEWAGPGHPSVAIGPDGRHQMFLHAFPPGKAGYKAFRALLTAVVDYEAVRVSVR